MGSIGIFTFGIVAAIVVICIYDHIAMWYEQTFEQDADWHASSN